MSYILEALRKSERERQLAQVPALPNVLSNPNPPGQRWLPWVLVMMLGIGCAILLWLWLNGGDKAPPRPLDGELRRPGLSSDHSLPLTEAGPMESDRANLPENSPVATSRLSEPPPVIRTMEEAGTGDSVQPPAPPSQPKQPTGQAAPKKPPRLPPPAGPLAKTKPSLATRRDVAQETVGGKPPRPAESEPKGVTSEPALAARPKPDGEASVIARESTPLLDPRPMEQQREMPELKINVLAYSSVPEERFAVINMVKYGKGDHLPGGAVLTEIQADGVILELNGSRFRIGHR